jgi:hypothetical protein
VYVTPTEQMAVRPGQHVSGDGRVYHHYLAHWGDAWDVSNTLLEDNFRACNEATRVADVCATES